MGTAFVKKPIGGEEKLLYPDPIVNKKDTKATIDIIGCSEEDIENNRVVTDLSSTISTNSEDPKTESSLIDNYDGIPAMNIEEIVKQIQEILKSPSPLTLYSKSAELKENFAAFINYIVKKIAIGFNSQNRTVILSMYQNAGYETVWFTNLKSYLDEAKYFDVRIYFKAITTFDKEKQYIAKTLLKLYKKTSDTDIQKFLKKYETKSNLKQIKSYYNVLRIGEITITDPKYLDENRIENFLEKLYFKLEDLGLFFQIFCFDTDSMKGKFSDTYEIFSDIARSYLKEVSPKTKLIYEYLYNKDNIEIIKKIDKQIDEYLYDKRSFYRTVSGLIGVRNSIERKYFWSYVKTQMINKYFKEVGRLFYWDKNACSSRNEWATLRGNFIYNPNKKYQNHPEVTNIIHFKKLILDLNKNILSPFLKPLIYSIVSEKLAINKKDLLKIRYLMTLVLSENYTEYKRMYNFFEDLEAFMDYNNCKYKFNIGKLKIFAADIALGLTGLTWLFFFAPVGVFISSFVLGISYIREHFFRFKAGIEWNLGVRTISIVALTISSFFWITNLDSTKQDMGELTSKIEKIGVYKTSYVTKLTVDKINNSGIKESIANIIEYNK